MKKKPIIITIFSIIVIATAIICVALFASGEKPELPKLTAEDISKIYYDDYENDEKELDIEEFLGYYNQIYDLTDEVDGELCTPPGRIVVELKNGKEMNMSFNIGKQFDVSFRDSEGEYHHYWGKQQEIANMLQNGIYRLN